jgi:hypothetical protein
MTANLQGAGVALVRVLRALGLAVLCGVLLMTVVPTTPTVEKVCARTVVQGKDTACVFLHSKFVQERVQANLPEPRANIPSDIASRVKSDINGNGQGALNINAVR